MPPVLDELDALLLLLLLDAVAVTVAVPPAPPVAPVDVVSPGRLVTSEPQAQTIIAMLAPTPNNTFKFVIESSEILRSPAILSVPCGRAPISVARCLLTTSLQLRKQGITVRL